MDSISREFSTVCVVPSSLGRNPPYSQLRFGIEQTPFHHISRMSLAAFSIYLYDFRPLFPQKLPSCMQYASGAVGHIEWSSVFVDCRIIDLRKPILKRVRPTIMPKILCLAQSRCCNSVFLRIVRGSMYRSDLTYHPPRELSRPFSPRPTTPHSRLQTPGGAICATHTVDFNVASLRSDFELRVKAYVVKNSTG